MPFHIQTIAQTVLTNITKQNYEMKLKEKTTEKLEGELRVLKIINKALIGILGVLFVVCIYGLMKKDDNEVFSALIVVPIALSAIIPLNYENIKKIKAELISRKIES